MNVDNTFNEKYAYRNPLFNDEHKKVLIAACKKFGKGFLE